MFRFQVTIIRQTFQYVDITCSVLTVWDISIHDMTCTGLQNGTFQYMDMTFSVLTVWDISVHDMTCSVLTLWDISVHGHDMFSAYSMGHFITWTWHVQCLEYGTFQYMIWHVQCLQYGTFQYMDMTCSVLTVWDISVHGHYMFSAYSVWHFSTWHDMFSAYSMGHFSTWTWHVHCLQYGTFHYMDMTCSVLTVWDISVHDMTFSVLQYGTFQYMDMTCSVLTVWDPILFIFAV